MKTLVLKEVRENVKVAVVGLIIYTALLVGLYRGYLVPTMNMSQPLVQSDLLTETGFFCALFGAVLGWLQIHNERRPDLWAFLLHRPVTRTTIFLGKALAGLGIYAVVVSVPLLVFVVWARWPGHVPAPFEPAMLLPVTAYVLVGIVYYFAGMLTGLRQARWYASRALGLGAAFALSVEMAQPEHFWAGLLLIGVAAAILITAAWGGLQSQGHYRAQPAAGKAALTTALTAGSTVVAIVVVVVSSRFFAQDAAQGPRSEYAMTKTGEVFKVTRSPGGPAEIVNLEGKPLLDPKTGRMIEMAAFAKQGVTSTHINVNENEPARHRSWMETDCGLFRGYRATSDTMWYYWGRYGRLVGYDRFTRRCIGSLGPKGFSPDIAGSGDRFNNPIGDWRSRTLTTTNTVFLVDVEQRSVKPLFTSTDDDPVLTATLIPLNGSEWEHTAVVTKKFVHLLSAEGKAVWKAPYEPAYPDYSNLDVSFLEPAGQFALWIKPSNRAEERANGKLPSHVIWLARDLGASKSLDLPGLPVPHQGPRIEDRLIGFVMPPILVVGFQALVGEPEPRDFFLQMLLFSVVSAVLVCLPTGWWLGRRYRLPLRAQLGWAVFHLLCGVPGLMAFLSVQEWPARVPCPNCKRLRVVDRPQCEHCSAAFAPPEKTGTEVFAPLLAG